jgi:UDP-N-acetylmuramate: L-alanyl-gamma-D-glutamyl-meso-diaminopimelate ligase
MWHYLPHTAVVTNVEFDHADIYRDAEAYRFAFSRFINLVPRAGTLVVGWETPVARELARRSFAPVESFGLEAAEVSAASPEGGPPRTGEVRAAGSAEPTGFDPTLPHPRWRADAVEHGPEGSIFSVYHDGECLGDVVTPLTGAFNVRNCLAAIAAAVSVGAAWDGIVEGLRTLRSVRRRMEIRGEVRGVTVIDDFAHHPTAVRETIDAVRHRFYGRRLVAVFEPRSYTAQRRDFQEPYRRALAGADEVILAGLFHPERYDAETGMDPHELVAEVAADGTPARYIADVDEVVRTLAPSLAEGDVVLFMSNGGFGGVHGKLLAALVG